MAAVQADRLYNRVMRSWVSLERLRRNRGYVLIPAFVVSTLIETLAHRHAPPDVRWMSIRAISMYVVFEIGLFFARPFVKR
jgi:sec-independent protein translocase protein TatC